MSAPAPGRSGDPFNLAAMMEEAKKVTKAMRDMEDESNVFRNGDYNNMGKIVLELPWRGVGYKCATRGHTGMAARGPPGCVKSN